MSEPTAPIPPELTEPEGPRPPPPPLAPLEEVIANTERAEHDVTLVGMFVRNLSRAALVGIVPLTVGIVLLVSGWIAGAVPQINKARAATLSAEADYHAALRSSQPLLTELSAARISPVDELEKAWFTFEEAPEADTRAAADQLMTVFVDQVDDARTARGDDMAHLVTLLSDATRARRRTSDHWHEWVRHTSTMRGRAVVVLGLADAPQDDLSRYDLPLPHEDPTSP